MGRTCRPASPAASRSTSTRADVIKKHEKNAHATRKTTARVTSRAPRADRPGVPDVPRRAGDRRGRRAVEGAAPLYDFTAADGVGHTVWRVDGDDERALVGRVCGAAGAVYRRRPSSGGQRGARAPAARAEPTARAGECGHVSRRRVSRRQMQILAVQPRRQGSRRPDARSHCSARCGSGSP